MEVWAAIIVFFRLVDAVIRRRYKIPPSLAPFVQGLGRVRSSSGLIGINSSRSSRGSLKGPFCRSAAFQSSLACSITLLHESSHWLSFPLQLGSDLFSAYLQSRSIRQTPLSQHPAPFDCCCEADSRPFGLPSGWCRFHRQAATLESPSSLT